MHSGRAWILLATLLRWLRASAKEPCDEDGTCGASDDGLLGGRAPHRADAPVRFNAAAAGPRAWRELHADKEIRVVQLEGLLSEHEARSLAGVHMRLVGEARPPIVCGNLGVLRELEPTIAQEVHTFGTRCLNASASARFAPSLMKHATFSTAFYSGDIPFTAQFDKRVQSLFDLTPEVGGRFQVTSHPPGTGYGLHRDCSDKATDRAATVLIYLADAEGGQTQFKELGLEVQPRTGRAVVWNSMKDGRCLRRSLHAAARVVEGRKFTLQRWYYNRSPRGLGMRMPEPQLPPREPDTPMLMCDEEDDEVAASDRGSPGCRWYDEWSHVHLAKPVENAGGMRKDLRPGEVHTVDGFLSPAQVKEVRQRLKDVGLTTTVRNGAVMRTARSKRAMLEDEVLSSVLLAVVDYANLNLLLAPTVAKYQGLVAPHSVDHLQYGALAKVQASSLAKSSGATRSGAGAHTDSDFAGRCLSAALHLRAPRTGGEFALLRCPLADCSGLRGEKLSALYASGGHQNLEEQHLVETKPGRLVFFLAENLHAVHDVLDGTRESLFLWMTCDLDDAWGRQQHESIHAPGGAQ